MSDDYMGLGRDTSDQDDMMEEPIIKDNDLICKPCATEAGLMKEHRGLSWYVGKDFDGEAGEYSGYETHRSCIVCDREQSKIHPLIEIEYLKVVTI